MSSVTRLGSFVLTIVPLSPPMKLSKLRNLCDKAINKYGDMEVGCRDRDYAHEVSDATDMESFALRVLQTDSLPGDPLDDSEVESDRRHADHFACIFYEA